MYVNIDPVSKKRRSIIFHVRRRNSAKNYYKIRFPKVIFHLHAVHGLHLQTMSYLVKHSSLVRIYPITLRNIVNMLIYMF